MGHAQAPPGHFLWTGNLGLGRHLHLEPRGPGLAHSYFRDPQTLLRFSQGLVLAAPVGHRGHSPVMPRLEAAALGPLHGVHRNKCNFFTPLKQFEGKQHY